jgi:sucrose-6-phosphate hydrolase SacC (GH32 family)
VTDPYFPRLHPRPDRGWINDPNGLARIDGRWHVFFQWNPESTRHERIHWGHASSPDLLHWRVEPAALSPRPGRPDSYGCYTGCLVDDDGTPTAVYSAVTDRSGRSDVLLARAGAVPGEWRQDDHPVLPMPADPRFSDVRDPFLFEFDDQRWAVIGAGRPGGEPAVLAYRVDKLTDWVPAGTLLDHVHVDLAVIGCNGVDVRHGVTNANLPEAAVKSLMIERARRSVVVADAAKLGEVHLGRVAAIDAFDTVVTDAAAPAVLIAELRDAGVDVLVAGAPEHP